MTAITQLDDEELYLAALLDDPSGIDLAEFCWIDEEAPDSCWRVWDFQHAWYRNEDTFQADQCARTLGKSVGVQMRAFAFPFNYAGQEMLITAPELNHLRPLTDMIEGRLLGTRLARELLPQVKGHGIARQPQFQVRFANGARIISRLPNKDGKGVKGQHPVCLEMDECLEWSSPVALADGTTLPIGAIVDGKLDVEVWAWNHQTGQAEPRRVVGWRRVPRRDRPLTRLGQARMTADHPVFVRGAGYLPASVAVKTGRLLTLHEALRRTRAVDADRTFDCARGVAWRRLRDSRTRTPDQRTASIRPWGRTGLVSGLEVSAAGTLVLQPSIRSDSDLPRRLDLPVRDDQPSSLQRGYRPGVRRGLDTAADRSGAAGDRPAGARHRLGTQEWVYCLDVADNHNFFAGGVLVHNCQDYPLAGWIELIETLKRGSVGARWRCHGVSRGVRDKFYEITQADSGWTVHRYMAVHRPTWSDAERAEKIATYGGSRENPDYKRNIYGEHGDATNPLFVLARLMAVVNMEPSYNEDLYTVLRISYELLDKGGVPIEQLLDLPGSHRHGYSAYWAGQDVGFTAAPSEILVFGQLPKSEKLRLLTRVHLERIDARDQMRVITHLIRFYGEKLRAFSLDKSGNGLPIWQLMLSESEQWIRDRIKGYNFSAKYAVGFEDRELEGDEINPEDAVIEKNIVEFSSDKLREYVDAKLLELPFDRELLTEWQGQNYSITRTTMNPYGKRNYSSGKFHTLDAARMMIAAKELEGIEAALSRVPEQPAVLDQFLVVGY